MVQTQLKSGVSSGLNVMEHLEIACQSMQLYFLANGDNLNQLILILPCTRYSQFEQLFFVHQWIGYSSIELLSLHHQLMSIECKQNLCIFQSWDPDEYQRNQLVQKVRTIILTSFIVFRIICLLNLQHTPSFISFEFLGLVLVGRLAL